MTRCRRAFAISCNGFKKVADATLSEETEILKEFIPGMFEVMHRVAKFR